MTRTQTVNEDKAALLREEVARGKIDRRDFMRMSALLGLTAVGGAYSESARAQSTEIVLANAGGDSVRGFRAGVDDAVYEGQPGYQGRHRRDAA